MSGYRYTLALHTAGKEVFRRWSGDREEMLRDMAHSLPHLDVDPHRAQNFALEARAISPVELLPGQTHSAIVLTNDLASRIVFEVKRTS
ncbi:hypothetical protein SEA_BRUHMOMENT_84 [Arthrobacter phage BruhMoment]|nr:hypothetical protein SEA_BRUHMOMENT_84 [Arthrobacter phage BruhMoment]